METYPLDIAANQVVRWLIEEQRANGRGFSLRATRIYAPSSLTRTEGAGVEDSKNDELTEITAVGLLEVSPPLGNDGWVLRVRVEDRLGPRLPDDEPAPEDEEEIGLGAFFADFIAPDRGTAFVNLEAESPIVRARFEKLLDEIRTKRHGHA